MSLLQQIRTQTTLGGHKSILKIWDCYRCMRNAKDGWIRQIMRWNEAQNYNSQIN